CRGGDRQEGVRAGRQGQGGGQHQQGRRRRAAVRAARQRRLPAAEGAAPQGQEHPGGGGRRPEGHAQLLPRGGHCGRRPAAFGGGRGGRAAPEAGAERGGGAVAEGIQARAAGDGEGQVDRPPGQPVRRLDGAERLRQERRVHLPRQQRAGDQGTVL